MIHFLRVRKKFLMICGLLFMLAFGLAVTQPVFAANIPGVVNADALNVRNGPGVGYTPVGVIYRGYAVTLMERNSINTWVKIKTSTGNIEGWVNASLLTTSADISTLPIANLATLEAIALINAPSANLRVGDTLDYVAVTTVGKDEKVAPLGRNFNSSWAYVRVVSTGQLGWINASLLTPSEIGYLPLAPVPALTAANSVKGTTAVAASGSTAIVTAGSLNVRRGDSINYDKVAAVTVNTILTVLGRNSTGTWAYVRTPAGQEGWVNASYLRYDPGISTLPIRTVGGTTSTPTTPIVTPTPKPTTATGAIVTVNTDALFVRYGPGLGYNSFALVYRGQQLILIGRSADSAWVKVQDATGTQGWVSAPLVIASVPLTNVAVLSQ